MSSENQDFVELRRLLALKRHEMPPPGFFDNFSRQVISRIKADETAPQTVWSKWLAKWTALSNFEIKPALAGGFGVAVCSVLGAAFFLSDPGVGAQSPSVAGFGQDAIVAENQMATTTPVLFSTPSPANLPSTGGMLSPGQRPSLFQNFPGIQAQPASFAAPGR